MIDNLYLENTDKDPHFGFKKVPINPKITFVAKFILDGNNKDLIHM